MDFAQHTIEVARQNVEQGGRPFATVIVKDGKVLAESPNRVAQTNDPTAHAEILAIREACMKLGTEHLIGTTIYVLAHPCPMCLGALYYCSPDEVVFLTTREAYEPYYVDDRKYFELDTFYGEFAKNYTNDGCRCATRRATPPSTSTRHGRSAMVATGTCPAPPHPPDAGEASGSVGSISRLLARASRDRRTVTIRAETTRTAIAGIRSRASSFEGRTTNRSTLMARCVRLLRDAPEVVAGRR